MTTEQIKYVISQIGGMDKIYVLGINNNRRYYFRNPGDISNLKINYENELLEVTEEINTIPFKTFIGFDALEVIMGFRGPFNDPVNVYNEEHNIYKVHPGKTV